MATNGSNSREEPESAVRVAAARWVVRLDRGLSEEEKDEFERWLLEDPRHPPAMERSSVAWNSIGKVDQRLARPIVERSQRHLAWRRGVRAGALAAAAAVVVAFGWKRGWFSQNAGEPPSVRVASTAPSQLPPLETKVLADGTQVRLNRGAQIVVDYTPAERRVRLARGEAYFSVSRDRNRPFTVSAGDVVVRVVGTAFNVNLQTAAVEVLVTEGTVQVDPAVRAPESGTSESTETRLALLSAPALVVAGQRAVVAMASASTSGSLVISNVLPAEVAQTLAWRDPLLRLGGSTLAELAKEFEGQTGRRIIIADPTLANLRVGGRFRSDDLDGFVRVLSEHYGIKSESATDGTLVLGRFPK